MTGGKWLGVSPREAWLEMEYSRLKGEVDYLRAMKGQTFSYSAEFAPSMLSMDGTTSTLRLAAQAGAVIDGAEKLHVYVKERTLGGVGLKYFISMPDIRSKRDRAAVLADMHDKLVFGLASKLWSEK
jgi:hypothetical protein